MERGRKKALMDILGTASPPSPGMSSTCNMHNITNSWFWTFHSEKHFSERGAKKSFEALSSKKCSSSLRLNLWNLLDPDTSTSCKTQDYESLISNTNKWLHCSCCMQQDDITCTKDRYWEKYPASTEIRRLDLPTCAFWQLVLSMTPSIGFILIFLVLHGSSKCTH